MGLSDQGAADQTLEERLRAAFQTQLAHTPTSDTMIVRVLDQTKGPSMTPRSRSKARRLLPPLAAGLILAVATAAVAVTVRHQSEAGSTATVSASASSSAPPPRTPNPAAVTAAEVARLLALAPVLPGARESMTAPLSALRLAMNGPPQPNMVTRIRWWTAPGTVAAALSRLDAERPDALTRAETDGPTTDDGVISQGLAFSAPDAAAYAHARLAFTVVAMDGGVAVRAAASAVWLPARTAAEHIPASATSVDIVLTRGTAITRRTLTGDAVHRLADQLNDLAVYPPGTYFCPASRGYLDVLTFHSKDAIDIIVTIAADGCQGVSVTANGVAQTGLSSLGTNLEQTLLSELDLPASFDSFNH